MWQKIEILIDAKGLNWAELARLIGVQDSRISKWRSGTGEVDRKQLLRIAKVLDAPIGFLADDSLDEPPAPARLPEDETALLKVYRAMKPMLDEGRAIRALAAAALGEEPAGERGEPAELPGPPLGVDPTWKWPVAPRDPLDGIIVRQPVERAKEAEKPAGTPPRTRRKRQV